MRGRWPLWVLLASSLTFLASLYLPWAQERPGHCLDPRPLNCAVPIFIGNQATGWFSEFGGVAGLLALGVIGAAGSALADRRAVFRLPLASATLALVFGACMAATQLLNYLRLQSAYDRATAHLAPGAYIGLAAASVTCLAGAARPSRRLLRNVSVDAVAGTTLTFALLAAFLVPQLTPHLPHPLNSESAAAGYQLSEQVGPEGVLISVVACFGLPLWWRESRARQRLAIAGAIAVLAAADLVPLRSLYSRWPWDLWLLLACALGLVVLAFSNPRRLLQFPRPHVADAATVAAGSLLLGSLFVPWQASCAEKRCFSTSGWSLGPTGLAGAFTVLLLLGLVGYQRPFRELAIGAAAYVVAAGLVSTDYGSLDYGAFLGFAGTAVLLVFALRRLRPILRGRFLVRLIPLAACLGILSFVIGGTTRGGTTFEFQSPWQQYELAAAAIFLVLRLLLRWSGRPRDSDEVVLLPIGLLAVTALELIFVRGDGISWEGWVSVFLCLLLAFCGLAERSGGLERYRIPEEIWRIDRISGAED